MVEKKIDNVGIDTRVSLTMLGEDHIHDEETKIPIFMRKGGVIKYKVSSISDLYEILDHYSELMHRIHNKLPLKRLKIIKKWAMPNKETFKINPIKRLIEKYMHKKKIWIDPFARDSIFNAFCKYTNDLNDDFFTTHQMDALSFLKTMETESIDGLFYDPPYSLRQLKECYDKIGYALTQEDTQTYFSDVKKEIARIMKPSGIVISFGWNSNGIGRTLEFRPIEILIVAHGGIHNDTICVVEKKINQKKLDKCIK